MHELLLVSSQNRHLATNRASTLLNTMPIARAGEHHHPPVQPSYHSINSSATRAGHSDAAQVLLSRLHMQFEATHSACRPSISRCQHDGMLPRIQCQRAQNHRFQTCVCDAGPLNFVFEKASLRGVISAQLAEAKGHKGSQALFCELADSLRSEEACKDINVFNHRSSLCS